ncbi:hypothetical protein HOO65_060540 [Ceratocystis lukuohia]|uniref:BTB domain-containing protein n=1 Tax=Ceratocystis lukuohia TaxID=2019550 RepID=A0ABR4MEL3_9PEZI
MPFKRIEVDPGGDTLIILPQRGGAPREKPLFTTESKPLFITEGKPLFITGSKPLFITGSKPMFTTESKPDDSGTLPEIHYLVSKKHLALASRRAQKMFAGDYKEAVPNDTDGLHHWKFDPIFDPTAFEIVIRIIHGKTRYIPRLVTIQILADISVIVDDLECQDAVWFFTKGWIDLLKGGIPTVACQDLTRWILISFVFKEPDLFESSTRTAIRWSPYYIPTHNLPLRPKIVGTL